jgi:hypothetical protein
MGGIEPMRILGEHAALGQKRSRAHGHQFPWAIGWRTLLRL